MDRRVSLRIRYDRRSGLVGLLALALLVAALLGYLAWGRDEVAASGPQAPLDHPFDLAQGRARDKPLAASAGLRGYYLTKTLHNGAGALTACADGYHFASFWEILDPSNLKYDTTLGKTKADSGQGPLAGTIGWVRTGYSSMNSGDAGVANCNAWTSSSSGDWGTNARLPSDWTAGGQDIHVWEVITTSCGTSTYVWCVADSVSVPVYLPIILKNSS